MKIESIPMKKLIKRALESYKIRLSDSENSHPTGAGSLEQEVADVDELLSIIREDIQHHEG